MKVLLIEPDAILASTYGEALRASGHDARVTDSGQAAINMIDDVVPDVILLEIQLVGHNGIEFLYELRSYSEWLELPVIVLSSVPPSEFADSKDIINKHLKISKYLYKPATTLTKLLTALEEVRYQPAA